MFFVKIKFRKINQNIRNINQNIYNRLDNKSLQLFVAYTLNFFKHFYSNIKPLIHQDRQDQI